MSQSILKCSLCGAFFVPRIIEDDIDLWCLLCLARAKRGAA